ncbi:MAG: type II toxin-antitoxin system RelE family toxin [Dehalococcoidia bacterium]
MKVEFKGSFTKDLKQVRDKALKKRVKETIELVEEARGLREVENIKKLRVGDRYYRISIGDYRLGLLSEGDTVIFVRFLHRKDVYRYFP